MSKQQSQKKDWKMPDWMEPYRKLIESGCGGQSAEILMNDKTATFFNNAVLCELIGMCHAKVVMLESLKKLNFLPNFTNNDIERLINQHLTRR